MVVDFLYSVKNRPSGRLASELERALMAVPSLVFREVHGNWGSLAFAARSDESPNIHETEDYLCILLGNPVPVDPIELRRSTGVRPTIASLILSKYISGSGEWPLSFSGPFAAFILEKSKCKVAWLTDPMGFVALYEAAAMEDLVVGSHVDAVAHAAFIAPVPDIVSAVDFILHGVVTHPFTFFEGVRPSQPAQLATLTLSAGSNLGQIARHTYWIPTEENSYRTIRDAAEELRAGVTRYINEAVDGSNRVACFLSAGEDSRVVASLVDEDKTPDAYIFLDSLNREGRISQEVARKLDLNLKILKRSSDHYLVNAEGMASLVGSGHQFLNAHSFPLAIHAGLGEYDAVFGGYFADTIIKGYFVPRKLVCRKLPFLPQVESLSQLPAVRQSSGIFSREVLSEVNSRRMRHLQQLVKIRPKSAAEWFYLWPGTTREHIPNLYANRRLFRSYEPFMSWAAIKVGAAAPARWKLNRRLFYLAFRPALSKTRWTPHADGRFPNMPWWANTPLAASHFTISYVRRKLLPGAKHDGPWSDWRRLQVGEDWKSAVDRFLMTDVSQSYLRKTGFTSKSFDGLNVTQKCNLLQVGIDLNRNSNKGLR